MMKHGQESLRHLKPAGSQVKIGRKAKILRSQRSCSGREFQKIVCHRGDVTALDTRSNFGKLLRRVEEEGRSLVIAKLGSTRSVLLSIMDYGRITWAGGSWNYRAKES